MVSVVRIRDVQRTMKPAFGISAVDHIFSFRRSVITFLSLRLQPTPSYRDGETLDHRILLEQKEPALALQNEHTVNGS